MAYQPSGGPYGRGNFKFTWRGATVLREIDSRIDTAMRQLQRDILSYLHSTLHRVTNEMADNAFVELTVEQGRKRTLRVGSTAPHTAYHEFRYHPQFREAMDEWAPKVTQYINRAVNGS